MLMFSFFRSHGSEVSHGSGCCAGFFQGYAWGSLCLYSCRLTEPENVPPSPSISGFFSSVLTSILSRFLWWHLRPLIIDNCNVRKVNTTRLIRNIFVAFRENLNDSI